MICANPSSQYSLYGHIQKLAEAEKKGIESAGGKVDIFQYVRTTPHSSQFNLNLWH